MAAYTLEGSAPAMHLESQLFSVPVSYTERWKTEHERLNPVATVPDGSSQGDISFYIPPSSSGLISLNDICLELELGILTKNKDTEWRMVNKTDGVAIANNPLHSIFSQLHVTVANKTISDASSSYPYRSYLDTLLTHSYQTQSSQMTSAGWYPDTAHFFNHDTLNAGELSRREIFGRGHYVELAGRVFSDLFDQQKPLITGVPITIRFVMAKPEFYFRIFDPDETRQFKIHLKNPRLSIRRHIPSPDYMIKVSEELQTRPCKYHVERVVVRQTDIPRGTQSTVISNMQIGQLPKIALIAFIDSADFHGKSSRNCFNFDHFNLQQISCEVDGQSFPGRPYTADFDKFQSLECYNGLLETLEKRNDPNGELGFSREHYSGGYAIYGMKLATCGRGTLGLIKQGNLSVSVTFAQPLKSTIMMIAYLMYDSVIEINQHRILSTDFTA
jgi:hypothetical protein